MPAPNTAHTSIVTRALIALILAYQAVWHRIHRCLDHAGWRFRICHYHPSCSAYGLDALARYPWPAAVQLTLFRIWRCHLARHRPFVMDDRV